MSSARTQTLSPPRPDCVTSSDNILFIFSSETLTDVFFTPSTKSYQRQPKKTLLTCAPLGFLPDLPLLFITPVVSIALAFLTPGPNPHSPQRWVGDQFPSPSMDRSPSHVPKEACGERWEPDPSSRGPGTAPGQWHKLQRGKSWLDKEKILPAEGGEAL